MLACGNSISLRSAMRIASILSEAHILQRDKEDTFIQRIASGEKYFYFDKFDADFVDDGENWRVILAPKTSNKMRSALVTHINNRLAKLKESEK